MQTAVEMKNIVKVYANGVVANNNINFSIAEGEIHALVGENGAGKTTLMKMLFGIEQPTEGTIEIFGKPVSIHSVAQALNLGLGMVQQHFMLVPSMTVAENILLGDEPVRGIKLDRAEAERITKDLCDKYSFSIDPSMRVEDLPVGDKQKVEILKVLYRQAKVIILDEPTAVLTPQETDELFRQLIILKEQGHTIVFISHKLKEVEAICDRVTIMRKGTTVGVYNMSDISTKDISELMMGQSVQLELNKNPQKLGQVQLAVDNLTYLNEEKKTVLDRISFDVRAGEILGVVGVEGNGQTELVDIISGALKPLKGHVRLCGEDCTGKSIREIRDRSVAHIPQERMSTGIASDLSITENMSSVIYRDKRFHRGPLLNWKKLKELSRAKIEEYTVKTASEKTPIKMLSGGNIQKVVVAREFLDAPKVILVNQPTRGVDVGAGNLIHNKMLELRDHGSAILLVTSDLTEAMSLSDSIIVMYNGKISGYFPDLNNIHESDLGLYMLGVQTQSEDEIRRCLHE